MTALTVIMASAKDETARLEHLFDPSAAANGLIFFTMLFNMSVTKKQNKTTKVCHFDLGRLDPIPGARKATEQN